MTVRHPIDPACGHHVARRGDRCACRPLTPNSPTTPDLGTRCRYCTIGTMRPRAIIDAACWATCDRCGTSRYITPTKRPGETT